MSIPSAPFKKVVCPDANTVCIAAADEIAAVLRTAAAHRGKATIALAGGSTPKAAYALMAKEPLVNAIPWNDVLFFFGDERHYPPTHPDSNFNMASAALLNVAPIPKENIIPIPTEGAIDDDAKAFCASLHKHFPNVPEGGFPDFDLMLLGIGPDGHTASLFPGTPAPLELNNWVTTCDPNSFNPAIKPPVKRITVTSPVIWSAHKIFVMATGGEKTPMLQKIFSEDTPVNPPVSRLLRQCKGEVTFFLDAPAANGL